MIARLDKLLQNSCRALAQNTSRRNLLAKIGSVVAGGSMIPLLPVARAQETSKPELDKTSGSTRCDYWRYCGIDGFLCSCCGGSVNSCPPGTEMSPVTWIGTCRNPDDGKNYIISYNDCCGVSSCGNCFCNRNEGDLPVYRPERSNSIYWCLGTDSAVYNCSTAIVLGVALEQ